MPAICISHYEYSTPFLVAFSTRHDVSYGWKGIISQADPFRSFFFSRSFLFVAVTSLFFLLEILLERSPYRMPFSFHSYERDIFLLCHSLEKLRIIIIIIFFFHFVRSNKSFYLLIVTCTNFSQIFLDPNSSSCF